MKFGVFDHMDSNGQALSQQYRERLELVAAYDEAGLYAYHLAEHHGTPLGMACAPSVFLAAVSQRTRRLRFGPLVYTLSLYHPLRLLEEICMLDQLSEGRLELGIGRGVSPIELGFYGVGTEAQARYTEVLQVVLQGLSTGKLEHAGEYFTLKDVPLELHPVQRPHPPLWYGVARAETASWAAGARMNIVTNGPAAQVCTLTAAYRAAWDKSPHADAPLPLMGMSRHVVIAATETAARAVAAPAYHRWYTSLLYLWRQHNLQIPLSFPEDFDTACARGLCLVGTPEAVRAQMAAEISTAGVNYLLCRIAFGDLPLACALDTVAYLKTALLPTFQTAT